jgi:aryl carrier-like protein
MKIGIHDNFFELGGDSLLMLQLLARLREKFGINLQLAVLFEHPTVESLSQLIDTTVWTMSEGDSATGDASADREEITL